MRGRKVGLLFLILLFGGMLSGCATHELWNAHNGTGEYKEGSVQKEAVKGLYLVAGSDGTAFLVPDYPQKGSVFSFTVPAGNRDIERFREEFSMADDVFTIRNAQLIVGPYNGKGYRLDVEFTSTLPMDRVVELFAGSGIINEEQYKREMHGDAHSFQIHYKKKGFFAQTESDRVDSYLYSIRDPQAAVKTGVWTAGSARDFLDRANYIQLCERCGPNFSKSAYAFHYNSKYSLPRKIVLTPLTVAADALLLPAAVAVTPVALVLFLSLEHSL